MLGYSSPYYCFRVAGIDRTKRLLACYREDGDFTHGRPVTPITDIGMMMEQARMKKYPQTRYRDIGWVIHYHENLGAANEDLCQLLELECRGPTIALASFSILSLLPTGWDPRETVMASIHRINGSTISVPSLRGPFVPDQGAPDYYRRRPQSMFGRATFSLDNTVDFIYIDLTYSSELLQKGSLYYHFHPTALTSPTALPSYSLQSTIAQLFLLPDSVTHVATYGTALHEWVQDILTGKLQGCGIVALEGPEPDVEALAATVLKPDAPFFSENVCTAVEWSGDADYLCQMDYLYVPTACPRVRSLKKEAVAERGATAESTAPEGTSADAPIDASTDAPADPTAVAYPDRQFHPSFPVGRYDQMERFVRLLSRQKRLRYHLTPEAVGPEQYMLMFSHLVSHYISAYPTLLLYMDIPYKTLPSVMVGQKRFKTGVRQAHLQLPDEWLRQSAVESVISLATWNFERAMGDFPDVLDSVVGIAGRGRYYQREKHIVSPAFGLQGKIDLFSDDFFWPMAGKGVALSAEEREDPAPGAGASSTALAPRTLDIIELKSRSDSYAKRMGHYAQVAVYSCHFLRQAAMWQAAALRHSDGTNIRRSYISGPLSFSRFRAIAGGLPIPQARHCGSEPWIFGRCADLWWCYHGARLDRPRPDTPSPFERNWYDMQDQSLITHKPTLAVMVSLAGRRDVKDPLTPEQKRFVLSHPWVFFGELYLPEGGRVRGSFGTEVIPLLPADSSDAKRGSTMFPLLAAVVGEDKREAANPTAVPRTDGAGRAHPRRSTSPLPQLLPGGPFHDVGDMLDESKTYIARYRELLCGTVMPNRAKLLLLTRIVTTNLSRLLKQLQDGEGVKPLGELDTATADRLRHAFPKLSSALDKMQFCRPTDSELLSVHFPPDSDADHIFPCSLDPLGRPEEFRKAIEEAAIPVADWDWKKASPGTMLILILLELVGYAMPELQTFIGQTPGQGRSRWPVPAIPDTRDLPTELRRYRMPHIEPVSVDFINEAIKEAERIKESMKAEPAQEQTSGNPGDKEDTSAPSPDTEAMSAVVDFGPIKFNMKTEFGFFCANRLGKYNGAEEGSLSWDRPGDWPSWLPTYGELSPAMILSLVLSCGLDSNLRDVDNALFVHRALESLQLCLYLPQLRARALEQEKNRAPAKRRTPFSDSGTTDGHISWLSQVTQMSQVSQVGPASQPALSQSSQPGASQSFPSQEHVPDPFGPSWPAARASVSEPAKDVSTLLSSSIGPRSGGGWPEVDVQDEEEEGGVAAAEAEVAAITLADAPDVADTTAAGPCPEPDPGVKLWVNLLLRETGRAMADEAENQCRSPHLAAQYIISTDVRLYLITSIQVDDEVYESLFHISGVPGSPEAHLESMKRNRWLRTLIPGTALRLAVLKGYTDLVTAGIFVKVVQYDPAIGVLVTRGATDLVDVELECLPDTDAAVYHEEMYTVREALAVGLYEATEPESPHPEADRALAGSVQSRPFVQVRNSCRGCLMTDDTWALLEALNRCRSEKAAAHARALLKWGCSGNNYEWVGYPADPPRWELRNEGMPVREKGECTPAQSLQHTLTALRSLSVSTCLYPERISSVGSLCALVKHPEFNGRKKVLMLCTAEEERAFLESPVIRGLLLPQCSVFSLFPQGADENLTDFRVYRCKTFSYAPRVSVEQLVSEFETGVRHDRGARARRCEKAEGVSQGASQGGESVGDTVTNASAVEANPMRTGKEPAQSARAPHLTSSAQGHAAFPPTAEGLRNSLRSPLFQYIHSRLVDDAVECFQERAREFFWQLMSSELILCTPNLALSTTLPQLCKFAVFTSGATKSFSEFAALSALCAKSFWFPQEDVFGKQDDPVFIRELFGSAGQESSQPMVTKTSNSA